MRKIKLCKLIMFILSVSVLCLTSCNLQKINEKKLKDIEFTVVPADKIESPMLDLINEQKNKAFRLTYSDGPYMYIGIGYGEKETGGYSITAEEVYLTEAGIRVKTSITGPKKSEHPAKTASYPYIVIKIEAIDAPVLFD